MKIYTKTGDAGSTRTLVRSNASTMIEKCDLQIEVLGTMDELAAHIGVVHESFIQPAEPADRFDSVKSELAHFCRQCMHILMDIGSHLAALNSPDPTVQSATAIKYAMVPPTEKLEAWIDEHDALLPPLQNFILPIHALTGNGDFASVAQVHVARTVCRRLERRLVGWCAALNNSEDEEVVRELYIPFFNRLSDALFVLARVVSCRVNNGGPEIIHRQSDMTKFIF